MTNAYLTGMEKDLGLGSMSYIAAALFYRNNADPSD